MKKDTFTPLKIGIIRCSLPSYFPDRYGVFDECQGMLDELCEEEHAECVLAPNIPQDGRQANASLDYCLSLGADFVLLIHGGFTMGDVARVVAASGVHMGVWATPEPLHTGDIQLNNFVSLNMSLSIARGVRDLRTHPVQWYFGSPKDDSLKSRLSNTLRSLTIAKRLKSARIGVIGGLAPTFYNMEVSTNLLKHRLGIEVEARDMAELVERMAGQDDARVAHEVDAMRAAAQVRGVTSEQMALTGRAVLSLRDISDENAFDALAVSDWPSLQVNPCMHPGAAFSWIEEIDNLPVASEGDVLGAVTQLAAKFLSGRVGYLLDITSPDFSTGDLLMWHGGGGPLYLANDAGAAWINHPMIGRGTPEGPCFGAIADLVFSDGPATIFRIAHHGGALFAMEASVTEHGESGFDGCRGWLRDFAIGEHKASLDDVVATVLEHGLEHHFVLVPGHWQKVMGEFAAWTGQALLGRLKYRAALSPRDAPES